MREHAIKLFLWRTGISWKFIALVWQTERTRTKSLIKLKKKMLSQLNWNILPAA